MKIKRAMMKKKKVLIAAGGTGGHLFPAQQLAELLGSQTEVIFAGHKLADSPYFKRDSFRFVEIAAAKIQYPFSFMHALVRGFIQSLRLFRKERPDVVVGFGSFHTVPVILAAVILRKKIVLYEANRKMGKVNRLFSPFATYVAAQFPLVNYQKFTLISMFPWVHSLAISKVQARQEYGLDPNCFTILVFGGSQGASFLNEAIPKALELLTFEVQVLHFGLQENPYQGKSVVKPFEPNMAKAYAAADFVIGRSGAGTISELIRYKVPSLLIPYPFAGGHQQDNAELLTKAGGAVMLLQHEATLTKIVDCITVANRDAMKASLERMDEGKRTAFEELI